MDRRKQGKQVTISIRLTEMEYDLIKVAAEMHYSNPSAFIRGASLERATQIIGERK